MSTTECRVEFLVEEGRWEKSVLKIKGPLLSVEKEKDDQILVVEVIEGFHLIIPPNNDASSKPHFRLSHTSGTKPELVFRTRADDLGVVEKMLSRALHSAALQRQHVERKKEETSTSALSMAGYLVKSNKIRKKWREINQSDLEGMKWQKRWFVLCSDQITYYESSDHFAGLGTFLLPKFHLHEAHDLTGRDHTFVIQTSNTECIFLTAESAEDYDKWLSVLKKYHRMEKARESVSTLTSKEKRTFEKSVSSLGRKIPASAPTTPVSRSTPSSPNIASP